MSTCFQFQGQASLFSDRSMPEQDTLLLAADQRTIRSILTIASLEDYNRVVYRRPDFMLRDAVLDTNQQLFARESQLIFTIREEIYYLTLSKRQFPLSFF